MTTTGRFSDFITAMEAVMSESDREEAVLSAGTTLLIDLVKHDDWLPAEYAVANPDRYQQYLLHCDARERFSVVSFVWRPGQSTPVHDHCTWGIIGVLRGVEQSQRYGYGEGERDFGPLGAPVASGPEHVEAVSPTIGDIHRVSNPSQDETAISIHVYGGNIGTVRRHVYDAGGTKREFVSGYVMTPYTQLWSHAMA